MIAANTDVQFHGICDTLDRRDLLADPVSRPARIAGAIGCSLREELEQTLMTGPATSWESRLADAGVPAGRVLTVTDALAQPQVHDRQLVHEVEVRGSSRPRSVPILGNGIHVAGEPPRPSAAPPRLGEHTAAVLRDLGYSGEEIAALRDAGAV